MLQKVLDWAHGKSWWWRAVIIIVFAILLQRNWHAIRHSTPHSTDPLEVLNYLFQAFDLGVHELGHAIFSPFGEFMHILGGSLFQCIFPLLFFAAFIQIRWFFAACMCLPWLGLNLFSVAIYANDARSRLLELTGGPASIGGDGSEQEYDHAHDWYQILSRTHHLTADHTIALYLRYAALGVTILGLALGTLLVLYMLKTRIGRQSTPVIN